MMPVGEMPPSLKKFRSSAARTASDERLRDLVVVQLLRLVVPNRPMRVPLLDSTVVCA